MHRGENVFANHALVEHDGVLIVVTLPRHVSYEKVTSQSQLSVLSGIAFGEDVALVNSLTFLANGSEVDGHVLVGAAELGNGIFLHVGIKADKLFVLTAFVGNANGGGIHKFNDAVTFCHNHGAGIFADLLLDACADNRSLTANQRNCLTHHVGAHQRTVGIVMLQERNERSSDGGNLLRSHVHELNLRRRNDRIVCILTTLHLVTNEGAVIVQGSISLTNNLAFFFFSRKEHHVVIVKVHHGVFNLAIRGLNETEFVNLRINAKRRNQTDVRTFRRLNRTETTIVGVVYVTNLETGTFTRQTAGAKSRQTALVGHLSQRVRLVHELRKCIGAEERIDDAGNGLGINQISRSEHFVVTHIHAFADGATHTCQADGKLIGQLLSHGANTTVAQVVNVIDSSLGVNELNKILDNLNNVFASEDTHIHLGGKIEFLVDSVAPHFTEVITLLGEEKVVDDLTCRSIVGRVCVAQLTIDVEHSFFLRVGGVLLKRIENDGEV